MLANETEQDLISQHHFCGSIEMKKDWRWTFRGFESVQEGRPIQIWFDELPEDAKYEIVDLLNFLQKVTDKRWRKPEFDPLQGAGGISEIRPQDIPIESNGKLVGIATYRIYGYFGPGEGVYTFLHGARKGVKNDRHGKRIAGDRLRQLERGEATTHEFNF
jgi:hypothetical protein